MTRQWPDVRAWLQDNDPTGRGMCLQTSMRAYDADAMGASDAAEAVGMTKDLHTAYTTDIPAGAHVLYSGGSGGHGHSVVADGGGYVWTVDWTSGLSITRVSQDAMEDAWGDLRWAGWSAYYGDQALHLDSDSGGGGEYPKPEGKVVYLDKLHYGQTDSDSVWHLQTVLNSHTLEGGQDLPTTGNYLDQTDEEVRLCQAQHGYGDDPAGGSSVGPKQADHLFSSSYTVKD